jgi:DegV family protein with EDD domain
MLIVTDGAVDLPGRLEHSPQLRNVPGQVWLDEKPFDGSSEEFWSLLRGGIYPWTTPPTVDALAAAYHHLDLVIAVHVSGELSATLARGLEASSRAGSGIAVVDTRSLSVGAGLIAAAVHRALDNPSGNELIVDFARSLPERLHTFALIQDVESLRRSDRSGLLPKGHLNNNHPLLLAIRGRVVPLEQPKNRAGAVKHLITHVRHSAGSNVGGWALGHGDATDCDELVEQLSQALGQPPSFLARLDPTVGTHVGPEAVVIGAISGPLEL